MPTAAAAASVVVVVVATAVQLQATGAAVATRILKKHLRDRPALPSARSPADHFMNWQPVGSAVRLLLQSVPYAAAVPSIR